MSGRTIKVDLLARVEGEGQLYVRVKDGAVADVRLKIVEPPRFFEALLRGRDFREAPDITARICGICPVAYQMSAVHAMEDALGVTVGGSLRALRRLLYCGEWIESHALHVYLLHAPDFLGYPDALRMAKDHPAIVQRGLRLKKAGNAIMRLLGGREIHPINVKVGGFFRTPSRAELAPLADQLEQALDDARETVRWTASLPMPALDLPCTFVALRHPDEYPFNEGHIVSSGGLDIAAREFDRHVHEEHVPYTHALHSTLDGAGPYLVGPLARYNLNGDRLAPAARQAAAGAGLGAVCRNPFQSIVVRAVEILQACGEARQIVASYEPPDRPAVDVPVRPGLGYAATEAPRGLLYHRYEIDGSGAILDAKIVPPTSQNQKSIEDDLRRFVTAHLDLPEQELQWRCEQIVRNYDPCLSCSTHVLRLEVDRP
ncbi:MAG: Ni/Fe hydrogenase subunit alpha [Acidobacteriota bacterium]|nr:Ni/Fe hydrogenase subunit alpha [Acidobacteriota bacterium]